MLILNQAPIGAPLSSKKCCASSSPITVAKPNSTLFSKPKLRFPTGSSRKANNLAVSGFTSSRSSSPSALPVDEMTTSDPSDVAVVGEEGVPLEGVIQLDKPGSQLLPWAQVGLLAIGDVMCFIAFSAIGRYGHGLQVVDLETLRTADPFVAGWILSAYFLGAYADDGRGENGVSKGIFAAAKSWVVGIPLGIIIRAVTSGHTLPTSFILVTMGSTAALVTGWRALACYILPKRQSQKSDVYRRGSPFELFELLTSLVRRW